MMDLDAPRFSLSSPPIAFFGVQTETFIGCEQGIYRMPQKEEDDKSEDHDVFDDDPFGSPFGDDESPQKKKVKTGHPVDHKCLEEALNLTNRALDMSCVGNLLVIICSSGQEFELMACQLDLLSRRFIIKDKCLAPPMFIGQREGWISAEWSSQFSNEICEDNGGKISIVCGSKEFRPEVIEFDSRTSSFTGSWRKLPSNLNLDPPFEKVDIMCRLFQDRSKLRNMNELSPLSAFQLLKRRHSPDAPEFNKIFPSDRVKDVKCFSGGFALLLSNGKVMQYLDTNEKVSKTVLPLRGVAFISVSNRRLLCLTKNLFMYEIALPFESPNTHVQAKNEQTFSHEDTVEEIIACSDRLQQLNDIRAQEEKKLSQLNIARKVQDNLSELQLNCRCSVHPLHEWKSQKSYGVHLELTNNGSQVLFGQFWRLSLELQGKDDHSAVCSQRSLPKQLKSGSSWSHHVEIPLNMLSVGELPIKVRSCLIFCDGDDNTLVVAQDVINETLNTIDFLQLKGILKESAPETKRTPDVSVVMEFSSNLLTYRSLKPFLMSLKDSLSQCLPNQSLTLDCQIFSEILKIIVELTERGSIKLRCFGSSTALILAVKRDFQTLKSQVEATDDKGDFELDSLVLNTVHELMEDLNAVSDEESEESVAQLKALYSKLRDITVQLQ